jgi:hypothetical protein
MIDKTDPSYGRLPEPESLNDSMSLATLRNLEAMANQSIASIEADRANSWRNTDPVWMKKSQSALNFYRYYLLTVHRLIDARNNDKRIVNAAMALLAASESDLLAAEDEAFDALMSLCEDRRSELLTVLAVAG